jgi:hypothetical protein
MWSTIWTSAGVRFSRPSAPSSALVVEPLTITVAKAMTAM